MVTEIEMKFISSCHFTVLTKYAGVRADNHACGAYRSHSASVLIHCWCFAMLILC